MFKRGNQAAKRKRSFKGKRRPNWITKRAKFGYGPVGGVSGSRWGTTQFAAPTLTAGTDRAFFVLKKSGATQISTGASGAYANFIIYPNNAIDPLGSMGSGTAEGFDPWIGTAGALFRSYIVHAFRVEISAVSGNFHCVLGFAFRPASSASPTSIAQMMAQPRNRSILLDTSRVHKMSMFATTAQVYGVQPQTVAIDDSYAAQYNAAPASEVRADVGIESTSANLATVSFKITITQYIEAFGRNTLSNA